MSINLDNNTNMETCQKLKFNYNSKDGVEIFDLTYYVPFLVFIN